MKTKNAHKRLFSLWGHIDRQHNRLIESKIPGWRVLDVGCGYGSLVNFLREKGYEAQGVDSDPASIEIARALFPQINAQVGHAADLGQYPDGFFDAVLLKDALHHLASDGAVGSVFRALRRILKSRGRIVIWDPNPTWWLKTARFLILHKDPEIGPLQTKKLLLSQGFAVSGVQYYETIGLPLSGGYVGIRWVPDCASLNLAIARLNHLLSRGLARLGLGKYLCWRYMIWADKACENP